MKHHHDYQQAYAIAYAITCSIGFVWLGPNTNNAVQGRLSARITEALWNRNLIPPTMVCIVRQAGEQLVPVIQGCDFQIPTERFDLPEPSPTLVEAMHLVAAVVGRGSQMDAAWHRVHQAHEELKVTAELARGAVEPACRVWKQRYTPSMGGEQNPQPTQTPNPTVSNFEETKSKAKRLWANLTDDELQAVNTADELADMISSRFGEARDKVLQKLGVGRHLSDAGQTTSGQ